MRADSASTGIQMLKPLPKIYIGYDAREHDAYLVAASSLVKRRSSPVAIMPLTASRLAESGLLRRPTDTRGQRYDIYSNAPMSTDFAISRFATPLLSHGGWAAFMDCDIVALADPAELFQLADPRYAVMCVKHNFDNLTGIKMDGQTQTSYPRKLWSSVMLFNCDHPAMKRLTVDDLNSRPGRYLHGFEWLHDSEIGALPAEWNVLAGLQPMPEEPKIVHFTLGVPSMAGVPPLPEHSIWWSEYADAQAAFGNSAIRQ